jgi:hypothetical protein
MTATGLYSVLMPLAPWENPEVVAVALASIRAQTLWPQAVMISCDGMPDSRLAAVLQDSKLPLTFLVGPGGEGVGPVLARGLLACRTDLVMRADADDISHPERAQRQVAVMQARPDLAVLSSSINEFMDERLILHLRSVPAGEKAISDFIFWRNPINHPAVMLRRPAIVAAGNYVDCPGFEDYHLWLRLYQHGQRLDNLAIPLVAARVGASHLDRRRGLAYALQEAHFLIQCGQQGLMAWPRVVLLSLLRCPLRLLPPALMKLVFVVFLRTKSSKIEPESVDHWSRTSWDSG